ncbi:menin [Condylostylus longicornis]|uniref:menin n=1 Tax=Condylostylus longicornis TaxID=2530218 RepID=UPI00244DE73C|nr:menin [Condylostylus longicornis]
MATSASVSSSSQSNPQNASGLMDPYLKSFFPLKSTADVVKIFQYELQKNSEPDLTLLSVITGYIEINLTSGSSPAAGAHYYSNSQEIDACLNSFPILTLEVVEDLYKKFQVKLSVIEKPKIRHNASGAISGGFASKAIIKKVSDIIYYSLIRSTLKDRAHLQNLYSYLSSHKLDCFGVALGVVAGMQILGYRDVHLAISEDHAWVVFNPGTSSGSGKNRTRTPAVYETIEVTWHGKGNEDKRGQDVSAAVESHVWLYLNGHSVICDRYMEVAAIVSSINIALTPNSDCLELAELQQALLWLLYDLKHLEKYPMSLGNLGELEEVSATYKRPNCEEIYKEAIKSARKYYENHHVYPYTYQGNYYYRQMNYRQAFASWANASDVIRLYTYSKDDEEIYKEFLDIANEMIPYIMKTESSGHSARSILRDSECFANLLRFYDGICQWEEGSLTPILHIGWAKPLVNTISKFDFEIRSQVIIYCAKEEEEYFQNVSTKSNEANRKYIRSEVEKGKEIASTSQLLDGNKFKKDEPKKTDIPTIEDITAACGEKILNPDFLLQGGGKLFAEQKQFKNKRNSKEESRIEKKNTVQADMKKSREFESELSQNKVDNESGFIFQQKHPIITLYSYKMKGLKDLLTAEKLNTHAISLQVTAQSQVAGKKVRSTNISNQSGQSGFTTVNNNSNTDKMHSYQNASNSDLAESGTRPKRNRRE